MVFVPNMHKIIFSSFPNINHYKFGKNKAWPMPGLTYNKPYGRIGIFSNFFSKNENGNNNKPYI